jgi:GNAT superfamily N-acetyltransferase
MKNFIKKLLRESLSRIKEGYDDVGIERVKSNPKLADQHGFTDKIENDGYTYLHYPENDDWHLWGNIKVFDNSDGTEVANSSYGKPTEESPMKGTIDVRPDKRRMGIGSKMYMWIEQLTGEKLHPDTPHSKSAEKMWANPKRKFGI